MISGIGNKRRFLSLFGALALAATMAAPALAEGDQVDTSVDVGPMTMSVSTTGLTASYVAGSATGTVTLVVDDPRELPAGWATSDGWYVSMGVASNFTGTGGNDDTLAATGLKVTGSTVTLVNGQDETLLGLVSNNTVLGGATPAVLTAAIGEGNGRYSDVIALSLTVPAYTRPDTYSSTLTSTLTEAAP